MSTPVAIANAVADAHRPRRRRGAADPGPRLGAPPLKPPPFEYVRRDERRGGARCARAGRARRQAARRRPEPRPAAQPAAGPSVGPRRPERDLGPRRDPAGERQRSDRRADAPGGARLAARARPPAARVRGAPVRRPLCDPQPRHGRRLDRPCGSRRRAPARADRPGWIGRRGVDERRAHDPGGRALRLALPRRRSSRTSSSSTRSGRPRHPARATRSRSWRSGAATTASVSRPVRSPFGTSTSSRAGSRSARSPIDRSSSTSGSRVAPSMPRRRARRARSPLPPSIRPGTSTPRPRT